jgi:DNA invertase Pin-like site-specific DNA recombinase
LGEQRRKRKKVTHRINNLGGAKSNDQKGPNQVDKTIGRPVTAALHADQVQKLYRAGISKAEIARRLKIGRTSVRRIMTAKER